MSAPAGALAPIVLVWYLVVSMSRRQQARAKKKQEPQSKLANGKTGTTASDRLRSLARTVNALPKIAKALLATGLSLLALYLTYMYAGADDLRTKVYQPLYSEVAGIEESLQANSTEKPVVNSSLQSVKRSGDFGRMPRELQNRIEEAYTRAESIGSDVPLVTEQIQRLVSARLTHLRTEEGDHTWHRNATKRLEQEQASRPGISPMVTFTFNHAGRSRGVDIRDPKNPKVSSPGGPTWVINDWIGYPDSITAIDSLFTENDFLYLDEVRDEWYYRLTREDLRRQGFDLRQFLEPLHAVLLENLHFQNLLKNEPQTLRLIKAAKEELADRVRTPKRIRDLIIDD
jgi:hypothetical protein